MGSTGTKPNYPSDEVRQWVKSQIDSNAVVMFSKTHCPYCDKAKYALAKFIKPDQYKLIELDQMDNADEIQAALQEITGGRTVPRVFVNGQFIGGGDDTQRKANNGELKTLLADVGLVATTYA